MGRKRYLQGVSVTDRLVAAVEEHAPGHVVAKVARALRDGTAPAEVGKAVGISRPMGYYYQKRLAQAFEPGGVRFGRRGPRPRVSRAQVNEIAELLRRQSRHRHPSRVASEGCPIAIIEKIEAATALSRGGSISRSRAKFTVARTKWTVVDVVGVLWRPNVLAVAAVCDRLASQGLPERSPAQRSPVLATLRDLLFSRALASTESAGTPGAWSWWAPFLAWLRRVAHAVPRGPIIHVLIGIRPPRERYAPTDFHGRNTSGWTRLDFLNLRMAGAGVVLLSPGAADGGGAAYVTGLLDRLDMLSSWSESERSWAGCAALADRLRHVVDDQPVDFLLTRAELASLWHVPLSK